MMRKSPARTDVGVRPRTCWKGGEMKMSIPAAWRNGDKRCS
jgi:hypothetical protein